MKARVGDDLWNRVAGRLADKLYSRLEDEGALPLPERMFDVVVDDPEMRQKHEYKGLLAISPRAAAVEATRRAIRDEGYRSMATLPAGDEQSLAIAADTAVFATVHRVGEHPQIAYDEPPPRAPMKPVAGVETYADVA